MTEKNLERVFEKNWQSLYDSVNEVLKETNSEINDERTTEDKIDEILSLVRTSTIISQNDLIEPNKYYVTDDALGKIFEAAPLQTTTTSNLYIKIQEALIYRGYDCPADGLVGAKTKKALVQFQKENNLPVGNLDFETLKALGIRK